jgi:hypothetical protein
LSKKKQTAADTIVLEQRKVDDPLMTNAELIHRRARAQNRLVGKVSVTGNAMTRIGALCFVRRRLGHHDRAAERFKNLYEGLYGSGLSGVDAGRVLVDSSIVAHDTGIAARIDRGAALGELILGRRGQPPVLSADERNRIIACVVLGARCEDAADIMPSGERNRRQVARQVDDLLDALDHLADHWGYKTKAA